MKYFANRYEAKRRTEGTPRLRNDDWTAPQHSTFSGVEVEAKDLVQGMRAGRSCAQRCYVRGDHKEEKPLQVGTFAENGHVASI